jgi:hypothetical protein
MKLVAFVALTLVCGTAAARDVGQIPANSDPKISTWFRTAKSPSGTACCDEADGYREGVPVKVAGGEPTVIFRSWWAASDGYHLSVVDPSDLRSMHFDLGWSGCPRQPHRRRHGVAVEGVRHPAGALLLTWPRDLNSKCQ